MPYCYFRKTKTYSCANNKKLYFSLLVFQKPVALQLCCSFMIISLILKPAFINLCITSNSELGNIKENVPVNMTGKELLIAFNARYFIENLRANTDEFVKVCFNSPANPCVIVPVEGDEFLYLILPVRMIGWACHTLKVNLLSDNKKLPLVIFVHKRFFVLII